MSDESATPAAEAADAGSQTPEATEGTEANQYVPNVVRVHGKEFDVNDPVQKAQLEVWDEAHAKLVGRQTNELGKLRQFAAERTPTKDELDLVKTAKAKAAEGDLDNAFDMLLGYTKETVAQERAKAQIERANSELWEEYFSERPELVKQFGRKRIKQVSGTIPEIFQDGADAFKILDDYWTPMVSNKVTATNPVNEKPTSPKGTAGKPPVTLTGGGKAPTKPAAPAASAGDDPFDSILAARDSRSALRKK